MTAFLLILFAPALISIPALAVARWSFIFIGKRKINVAPKGAKPVMMTAGMEWL